VTPLDGPWSFNIPTTLLWSFNTPTTLLCPCQLVHAALCALVVTEAAKKSAWADYAAMILDEETAAFYAKGTPQGLT
jgi:hypothetical protein